MGSGRSDGDDGEPLYDALTLAALAAFDPPSTDEGQAGTEPLPSKVSRWSRSTAMGMVLTGFALGIQEVLDPADDRPIVIEVDDDGEPHHLPVQLFLDPDSPSGSLCLVRREAFPPPTR